MDHFHRPQTLSRFSIQLCFAFLRMLLSAKAVFLSLPAWNQAHDTGLQTTLPYFWRQAKACVSPAITLLLVRHLHNFDDFLSSSDI